VSIEESFSNPSVGAPILESVEDLLGKLPVIFPMFQRPTTPTYVLKGCLYSGRTISCDPHSRSTTEEDISVYNFFVNEYRHAVEEALRLASRHHNTSVMEVAAGVFLRTIEGCYLATYDASVWEPLKTLTFWTMSEFIRNRFLDVFTQHANTSGHLKLHGTFLAPNMYGLPMIKIGYYHPAVASNGNCVDFLGNLYLNFVTRGRPVTVKLAGHGDSIEVESVQLPYMMRGQFEMHPEARGV
jgi:hypothetical protein